MKRLGSPSGSTSKSLEPPLKKQQTASIFNKKTTITPSANSMFKQQPHLKTNSSGGACHVVYGNWKGSEKIAAFDLDGTIIRPKSNAPFPKDENDWQFWNRIVPVSLKELHSNGFSIVFISNQAGQPHVQQAFVKKLGLIGTALAGIPFRAFAAFDYDQFRKPCIGIWHKFVKEFNDGIEVDYKESFYCGDAAGRQFDPLTRREKDHSDTDRKMAVNAGLNFHTPEEFFQSLPIENNWVFNTLWNPATYDNNVPIFLPSNTPLIPRSSPGKKIKPEVIFFIGPPCSGKTFFFNQHFEDKEYISINPDLTSRAAALALLRSTLSASTPSSIVIDSRLPSISSRAHYLNLLSAEFPKITIRAFFFGGINLELCRHNSFYRTLYDESTQERSRGVVREDDFSSYETGEREPNESEGFVEIKRINFSFSGNQTELNNWNKILNAGKKRRVR